MPILTQFALSLEYQVNEAYVQTLMKEKNLEYFEATRADYAANWKAKDVQFQEETRCITALYEQCFEKFKTDDCGKIVVNCVDQVTDSRVQNYPGGLSVQVPFQSEVFFKSSGYETKKMALELLKQGVDTIVEAKGWDQSRFEIAYQKVVELDYENKWVWKKR